MKKAKLKLYLRAGRDQGASPWIFGFYTKREINWPAQQLSLSPESRTEHRSWVFLLFGKYRVRVLTLRLAILRFPLPLSLHKKR